MIKTILTTAELRQMRNLCRVMSSPKLTHQVEVRARAFFAKHLPVSLRSIEPMFTRRELGVEVFAYGRHDDLYDAILAHPEAYIDVSGDLVLSLRHSYMDRLGVRVSASVMIYAKVSDDDLATLREIGLLSVSNSPSYSVVCSYER